MSDVTHILSRIESGDSAAAEELLPLIYGELRKLAAARLAQEKPGQTLQATALVHEAYLRLVDVDRIQKWDSRGHFFSAAAEAMRKILIDLARKKQRVKHGGDRHRVDLNSAISTDKMSVDDLLAIDEALDRLAQKSPEKAQLVKLRFYAGMSLPEAAQSIGISLATAERYWTYAKCWLYAQLQDGESNSR
jgi:RNA polymerase sigma factor (TIGR02999 family)